MIPRLDESTAGAGCGFVDFESTIVAANRCMPEHTPGEASSRNRICPSCWQPRTTLVVRRPKIDPPQPICSQVEELGSLIFRILELEVPRSDGFSGYICTQPINRGHRSASDRDCRETTNVVMSLMLYPPQLADEGT